ncbi:transcriptional regulator with GAF, ATPase, and Fis domain [Bradyrhizobium sp. GM6.1]
MFLDEIGEISASFQAKLLRVLQEQEFERVGGNQTIKVDVRVIAATNKNLEEAVARKEFRADLYYRISVVPLLLPPLRERRTDIPLLAARFLKNFNNENGRALVFESSAIDVLMNCGFPGNVRELGELCAADRDPGARIVDRKRRFCLLPRAMPVGHAMEVRAGASGTTAEPDNLTSREAEHAADTSCGTRSAGR